MRTVKQIHKGKLIAAAIFFSATSLIAQTPYKLRSTTSADAVGAGNFIIQDNNALMLRLLINSMGNVGIGLTNPLDKLSVAGIISSTTGGFRFPDGTVQTSAAVGSSSQWTTNGNNIYFNSGNAGLGVSNPSSTLDIAGAITFASMWSPPQIPLNNQGRIYFDDNSHKFKVSEGGSGYKDLLQEGWSLNGNAGINYPTNFIGTTDNKPLLFKTNNSPRLILLEDGKVQIPGPLSLNSLAIVNDYIDTYQQGGPITITGTGNRGTFLIVNASSGNVEINLTDPFYVPGKMHIIKKIDNSLNTVTIKSQELEGGTDLILNSPNESVTLIASGYGYTTGAFDPPSRWMVVSKNKNAISTTITGGTLNKVAKFNAAGNNIVNSQITDDGINVGIGTSTPEKALDVREFLQVKGDISIPNTGANEREMGIKVEGEDCGGCLGISVNNLSSGNNTRAGINLSNLNAPVLSSISLYSQINNAGSSSFIMRNQANGSGSFLDYLNINLTTNNIFFNAGKNGGNPYGNILILNGNVGVGTNAPAEKLTVSGIVSSTTGGFKFPDGTIQTSATSGDDFLPITGGTLMGNLTLTGNLTLNASSTINSTVGASGLTLSYSGIPNVIGLATDISGGGGQFLAFVPPTASSLLTPGTAEGLVIIRDQNTQGAVFLATGANDADGNTERSIAIKGVDHSITINNAEGDALHIDGEGGGSNWNAPQGIRISGGDLEVDSNLSVSGNINTEGTISANTFNAQNFSSDTLFVTRIMPAVGDSEVHFGQNSIILNGNRNSMAAFGISKSYFENLVFQNQNPGNSLYAGTNNTLLNPYLGNVGIGTTNPERTLDVRSRIMVRGAGLASLDYTGIELVNDGTDNYSRANLCFENTHGLANTNHYCQFLQLEPDGSSSYRTRRQMTNGFLDYLSFYLGNNNVVFNDNKSGDATYGNVLVANGNVGIGTNLPEANLQINNTDNDGVNGKIFSLHKNNDELFSVTEDGHIGMGTPSVAGYRLDVKGKIRTCEVFIEEPGDWCDYVFEPNYKRMSLNELEYFLKQKKHLPNIPSAKQLKDSGGIHIGEMQKAMMEKIEELYLYTIDLSKRVEKLSQENNELKAKIENKK